MKHDRMSYGVHLYVICPSYLRRSYSCAGLALRINWQTAAAGGHRKGFGAMRFVVALLYRVHFPVAKAFYTDYVHLCCQKKEDLTN